MTTGAVLLAGGRGSRLGGLDKAVLRLAGSTLLERALDALAGLPVAVVGPDRPWLDRRTDVVAVQEEPPFSGPAAAVVAGLAALPAEVDEVLLLAVDVAALPAVVPLLLNAGSGPDGVVALDESDRVQWLLGRYAAAALRSAADRLGDPAGASLQALLGRLTLGRLRLPEGAHADVDTAADAAAAGVELPRATATPVRDDRPTSDDVDGLLDAWWRILASALSVPEAPPVRDAILGLAGEAAHGVIRPAAPVTTFLAGYAAGLAGGSAEDVAAAIERARAAIRE